MTHLGITLNADQERALSEILAAMEPGRKHLLTGYAGSGKTTLVQVLAAMLVSRGMRVNLTAPTHKAVAVLARKFKQVGTTDGGCITIHSLLSLTPKPSGDRLVFERKRHADPVNADIVVIDECSMVSEDLMKFIRRHLSECFVLFVGDPAQIPPVGEEESQTFGTKSRSHLNTIVRQGAGNPILDAADAIRRSQGGEIDWSWCRQARADKIGVFTPGQSSDAWMHRGFTSQDFASDPDSFRYLCWTNDRVAQVNAKVRRWLYGDNIPTPFMPGERALVRQPVVRDKTIILATNEEATVLSIEPGTYSHFFDYCGDVGPWTAEVPSWLMTLRKDDGEELPVHMARDDRSYNKVLARIADEAGAERHRWGDHHAFKSAMARLQSIYAMTVHTSQGSTFRNAFVDVPDIRRRMSSNLLETQQLFYVAVTRPTHALVLVGVGQ